MNNWLNKWPEKVTEEWKKIITSKNSSAGKMYGMVKTRKNDDHVCVITSCCNNAIEELSTLVEKPLYPIADNLPPKIKDANNMLEIIGQLNEFVLTDNFVLVSFDAVNMSPSIDNRSVTTFLSCFTCFIYIYIYIFIIAQIKVYIKRLLLFTADRLHKTLIQKVKKYFQIFILVKI